MIVNQAKNAVLHLRHDDTDVILNVIGIEPLTLMTPTQARDLASTLIRLADAADESVNEAKVSSDPLDQELETLLSSMVKQQAPSIKRDIFERAKGTFTAEGAPLGVIVNDRQVMLLPGMSANVGNTGPGAYDFITYKGFEIIMREDELSDSEGCPEYNGPFFIGPDMLEVPDIEGVKKFLDEMVSPIPATKPEPRNDPKEMTITIAQAITLHNKWNNEPAGRPFRDFLATVTPMFAGDGAITVPWCGMILAIETDGHSHS
jgi:hypothetical protein